MSLQVKVYGDLKDKLTLNENLTGIPAKLYFKTDEVKTISDILNKLDINDSEISHIFVNGKYCGTGKEIYEGDRIGIFPKKMALMFVEISKNNSIYVTIKFFADLQQYGPSKLIIDLPEGSTIKTILEKYRIPKEKKLIILRNAIPIYNNTQSIKDGDTIAIFPPLAGG